MAYEASSLRNGIEIIQSYVNALSSSPGVYRMLGHDSTVLYVGKAKNLKKRVMSYTQPERLSLRIQRMVSLTRSMEFAVTHTETEALLMEATLIKTLKPRFNILFRDDKSFPFILLTEGELPSRLMVHRGAKTAKGQYFGPFASTQSVHTTLDFLSRTFKLRTCTDPVFAPRARPCLQYHIKRCTAPCVGKVSWDAYQQQVEHARQFLMGKTQKLQYDLAAEMECASEAQRYEDAALKRDQIQALTTIQAAQGVGLVDVDAYDVVAVVKIEGKAAVQIFFYRHGSHYGNRAYFPDEKDADEGTILQAFLGWFYTTHPPPEQVIVSHELPEAPLIQTFLSEKAERKVEVVVPQRGARAQLIKQALHNARESLLMKVAATLSTKKWLEQLMIRFDLPTFPRRIEVYDNSHIQGKDAYGVMVVTTPEGFDKKSYRKFKINPEYQPERGGDDYAMMREVLRRRFYQADAAHFPDLILLDGGQGQLSAGRQVLEEMALGGIPIVGIAKGPERNAGRERFFMEGRSPFTLEPTDPLLHYVQRLRDEAHRFAIGTHRQKRVKSISQSRLDDIKGIGIKRKRDLLRFFGSLNAIAEAGVADLQKVPGINQKMAQIIYDYFH